MKFLKKHNRKEGGCYDRTAIISYGTSVLNSGKYDGWYFKLELPFNRTKKYIDSNTFEIVEGQCSLVLLYSRRNANEYRGSISRFRKEWSPIDV